MTKRCPHCKRKLKVKGKHEPMKDRAGVKLRLTLFVMAVGIGVGIAYAQGWLP